jgi:hypothetical protein
MSLAKCAIVGGPKAGGAMMSMVPILVYHAVSDNPPGWIAPYTVSPATFAAHLDLVVTVTGSPLPSPATWTDGATARFRNGRC